MFIYIHMRVHMYIYKHVRSEVDLVRIVVVHDAAVAARRGRCHQVPRLPRGLIVMCASDYAETFDRCARLGLRREV